MSHLDNTLPLTHLTAVSPIDGRYGNKTAALRSIFSEYALIKYRVKVELAWFKALSCHQDIPDLPKFSQAAYDYLMAIGESFSLNDAKEVKRFEQQTNHDVKAVEYFVKAKLAENSELSPYQEFVHFACTSEDINNVAYGLICQQAREHLIKPKIQMLITQLSQFAKMYADAPMLARTHGQPATPTTMGKEVANFVARLSRQAKQLNTQPIRAKFNGAVGNYNVHYVVYPNVDWLNLSRDFIEQFALQWNCYTTQIETHDYIAELFAILVRFNQVLIDFCRDVWGYISLGYLIQKPVAHETGSSTMPHKVNPIDFENAEGNLGLANSLMDHLGKQLMVSRWQRDLVDSTLLRNMGSAFAYSSIAYDSLLKGLGKLSADTNKMEQELSQSWELLAEPIQTMMRRYGVSQAYEKLKTLTRGHSINRPTLEKFIHTLEIPDSAKQQLLALFPCNYLGLAQKLASNIDEQLLND